VIRDGDEMTLGLFKHLSLVTNATGNGVPDTYLAALALRYDAVFLTADAAFRRFQMLSCEILSDPQVSSV